MVNLFCNALPPFVGGSVIPPQTVRPFQVGTKAKDRTVKYRQSFLFYLKFPLKKRTLSRSHFVTLWKNTIQKLLLSCIIIFLILGKNKEFACELFAPERYCVAITLFSARCASQETKVSAERFLFHRLTMSSKKYLLKLY